MQFLSTLSSESRGDLPKSDRGHFLGSAAARGERVMYPTMEMMSHHGGRHFFPAVVGFSHCHKIFDSVLIHSVGLSCAPVAAA